MTVTYYDSDEAPSACVADGVAIATGRQRRAADASNRAGRPGGAMAVIVVHRRASRAAVGCTVSDAGCQADRHRQVLRSAWPLDAVVKRMPTRSGRGEDRRGSSEELR